MHQSNALCGDDWLTIRQQWALDFSIFQFGHNAYGACPIPVRERNHPDDYKRFAERLAEWLGVR